MARFPPKKVPNTCSFLRVEPFERRQTSIKPPMSRVVWLEISLFRRGLYRWRCFRPKLALFYAALGMKCTYKKSYYGHSSEVGPFQKVVECEFYCQENQYLYAEVDPSTAVSFTRGILTRWCHGARTELGTGVLPELFSTFRKILLSYLPRGQRAIMLVVFWGDPRDANHQLIISWHLPVPYMFGTSRSQFLHRSGTDRAPGSKYIGNWKMRVYISQQSLMGSLESTSW